MRRSSPATPRSSLPRGIWGSCVVGCVATSLTWLDQPADRGVEDPGWPWVGACIGRPRAVYGRPIGWLEQKDRPARGSCGWRRAWRRCLVSPRSVRCVRVTARSRGPSAGSRGCGCGEVPRATSATRCCPPKMVSEPHGGRKTDWTGSAHEASPVDAALRVNPARTSAPTSPRASSAARRRGASSGSIGPARWLAAPSPR